MPILSGIVSKVRVETESTVGAFVGRAILLQGVVPPDLMTGSECSYKGKPPNGLFLLQACGFKSQYG